MKNSLNENEPQLPMSRVLAKNIKINYYYLLTENVKENPKKIKN